MTVDRMEMDKKWFDSESDRRGLTRPGEKEKVKFAKLVRERHADIANNQSIDIIRDFGFSVYLWGGLGKMPNIINQG